MKRRGKKRKKHSLYNSSDIHALVLEFAEKNLVSREAFHVDLRERQSETILILTISSRKYTCPLTGQCHHHQKNAAIQVHVDLTFNAVFQIACTCKNPAVPISVCQSCQNGLHTTATHKGDVTGLRSVCAKLPDAELRFPARGDFLKFGGLPTKKTYHGRQLINKIEVEL